MHEEVLALSIPSMACHTMILAHQGKAFNCCAPRNGCRYWFLNSAVAPLVLRDAVRPYEVLKAFTGTQRRRAANSSGKR